MYSYHLDILEHYHLVYSYYILDITYDIYTFH